MFYPSRVTQFVINGSRGDGKDSYSLSSALYVFGQVQVQKMLFSAMWSRA